MPLMQYVPADNYVNYNRATNYLRKVPKSMSQVRKRSSARYNASRSRVPRNVGIHHYIRNCQPVTLQMNQFLGFNKVNGVTVTTPNFGVSLAFSLDKLHVNTGTSSVDNTNTYTDLTSLYDQYRIDKVEVKLIWCNNTATGGNSYVCPVMQSAIDYDDVTAPTNNTTLTQFSTLRVLAFGNKSINVYKTVLFPKISEATTTSNIGGSVGTVLRKPSYINTETPDVFHTGYKLYWDVPSDFQTNVLCGDLQIYVKYYLPCKLVK